MTDQTSARLDLPYLMPAQAQKHVTVNESLRRLDGLVQASAASRTQTAPPADPEPGTGLILPDGVSGEDWPGFASGDLAVFQDGAWARFSPRPGWIAWAEDEAQLVVFDGAQWRGLSESLARLANLDRLGVGTQADAANPFAAKLNAALWTALEAEAGGTGDLRYVMNKQAEANTASLLFQSGFSGRAEIGLAGGDDLSVKVSADGQDWVEALRVDAADGALSVADGRTVYHAGNLLGAVFNQAGEVAGAAIERGANANGDYVRFADGTQICTRDVVIEADNANVQVHDPAAPFLDDAVFAGLSGGEGPARPQWGGGHVFRWRAAIATLVGFHSGRWEIACKPSELGLTGAEPFQARLIAVGRWT